MFFCFELYKPSTWQKQLAKQCRKLGRIFSFALLTTNAPVTAGVRRQSASCAVHSVSMNASISKNQEISAEETLEHVAWVLANLGFPYLGPIIVVKTVRILLSEAKHSHLRKRLRLTYLFREGQYALTSLAVSTAAFYELVELAEWSTRSKLWLAAFGVLSFFAVILVVIGLIAETDDPENYTPWQRGTALDYHYKMDSHIPCGSSYDSLDPASQPAGVPSSRCRCESAKTTSSFESTGR